MRFHAAREVHRFAPQIVDEFLAADHAGHHRPGIDADPESQPSAAEGALRNGLAHVQRQLDQHPGMVRTGRGTPEATM